MSARQRGELTDGLAGWRIVPTIIAAVFSP